MEIPGVSTALGKSAGEAQALSTMQARVDDIEGHSMQNLKDDFARAEELRKQGHGKEAEMLQNSAKQQLTYMGVKAQKAHSASELGDGEAAVKELQKLRNYEVWNVGTHTEGAKRQETAGQKASEITAVAAASDAENLGVKFYEMAQTGADKLSPEARAFQVRPDVRAASESTVNLDMAPIPSQKTPETLALAREEFKQQVGSAEHVAGEATVGNTPALAHDASVELAVTKQAGEALQAEQGRLSVDAIEAKKKMFNLAQNLRQDSGGLRVSEKEMKAAAENIKKEHSAVLGSKGVDDIFMEAADNRTSTTYGWLAKQVRDMKQKDRGIGAGEPEVKVA